MSHWKPHFEDNGMCRCGCRKCSIPHTETVDELCICPDCNAEACGLHPAVIGVPTELQETQQ